jgi:hypothetical protein
MSPPGGIPPPPWFLSHPSHTELFVGVLPCRLGTWLHRPGRKTDVAGWVSGVETKLLEKVKCREGPHCLVRRKVFLQALHAGRLT